ncbi:MULTISPECIES: TetR/AcrR family transcriptional regulator [Streptomyces]|uniref:TetR/AcrR family transcriptional regulator n=1 Tax=Streptomyces siderophoricus TaxID=2802281 RepID=A0ABS1MVI0_9ACTN|nr:MULTISPECIES: TetR/AcrR family transcriptional regulator [unclassified Streptomyces]MBL1091738.1 TetR/AcrR family transcriptional regulator [Streptomyces sp. 9-7]
METLREKYAENTRRTLLDTALRLFSERAYASVSAEELVRTAGLTRGALYHHFNGKLGLFEAVFEDLERQATQRITAAIDPVSDPRERADHAVDEFLDICMEPTYRHIVLQQGPIALGWQQWRALDQRHLGGLVLDIVQTALDAGRIRPHPAELIARAFYGALTELSLAIAETDNPDQARTQAADLVRDLVDGLAIDAHSPSA